MNLSWILPRKTFVHFVNFTEAALYVFLMRLGFIDFRIGLLVAVEVMFGGSHN